MTPRSRIYVCTAHVGTGGARLTVGTRWGGDVVPAACPFPARGRIVAYSISLAPSGSVSAYVGPGDYAGSFSTSQATVLEAAGRAVVIEPGEGIDSTPAAPFAAQALDFAVAPASGTVKIRITVEIVDDTKDIPA